jgi:hypothetical protein
MNRYRMKGIVACVVMLLVVLAAQAAVAAQEVRVTRIHNDPTLLNQEVVVKGTVEQIETLGEGMTRGRFILRDAQDGETIRIESDKVPAPGPDVVKFTVLVKRNDTTGSIYLWHLTGGDSGGWTDLLTDPITIIAIVFLLLMGFLVYYLLRSDKQASVSLDPPVQASAAPQQAQEQPQPAQQPEQPAPAAKQETLDTMGSLVVVESDVTRLVGERRSVVLRGGQGILGRDDADINIDDGTFSSRSAVIKYDAGTRTLVIQNIKKGRKLVVVSSGGDQTTLNFNEEVQLDSGDTISQERSALKLRFEGIGPQKTRDA